MIFSRKLGTLMDSEDNESRMNELQSFLTPNGPSQLPCPITGQSCAAQPRVISQNNHLVLIFHECESWLLKACQHVSDSIGGGVTPL